MLRNIIFDYGKVLVDWDPHYLFDPYFKDPEECRHVLHDVLNADFHNAGDLGRPIADVEKEWSAKYPEYAWAIHLYYADFEKTVRGEIPGMYDLVKELKDNGFHVYGLSNWSWETHQKIRHKCPVFGLLEGEVISGLVHMIKPHPDIYQYCLDTYKLLPEESVFIDDRQVNIDGAEAVGIHGLLFHDTETLRKDLKALSESLRQEI